MKNNKKKPLLRKMFLPIIFLAFSGVAVFGGDDYQEIDSLLFLPNSASQFVNEAQAAIQLDHTARHLMFNDFAPGQIAVYGYAANVANDIEAAGLSRERAVHVINELVKRGVSKDLFAEPVGYGSVDLWGSNIDEEDRSPNRRVRIVIDGNVLPPVIILHAEPVKAVSDTSQKAVSDASPKAAVKSRLTFPWWALFLLLALASLILFLVSRNRKDSFEETKHEALPQKTVMPAAVPEKKIKILTEEEIRSYAYNLYEDHKNQHGLSSKDWYNSICEQTNYYKEQGYQVKLYWEAENAS